MNLSFLVRARHHVGGNVRSSFGKRRELLPTRRLGLGDAEVGELRASVALEQTVTPPLHHAITPSLPQQLIPWFYGVIWGDRFSGPYFTAEAGTNRPSFRAMAFAA